MKKRNQDFIKNSLLYIVLLVVVIATLLFYNSARYEIHSLTTGELITAIKESKVTEMTITPKSSESIYYITGKLDSYSSTETFTAKIIGEDMNVVTEYANDHNLNLYDTNKDPGSSPILYIVANVLPLIVLSLVAYFLFMQLAMSNNKSMDFGRSRAKLSEDGGKVRFTDVAGLKEEKEEVAEIIDCLKSPKKFQKLGARIPKGVLLVGPPGTGKTLLAKAIAGEANCPFYFISGSDFVELFVGVGASRVREMFKDAKKTAPCLIFIDEIDAVGRQRGTGLGGEHDEREQTHNQLLTEMDGFGANEGIIIIAATNRPDVLDPALLRPGRFDRQVTVSLPDQKEREAILKVHARNKTFDKSVNLENLSKRTPGFSGADLENLLNEAALLAVRRNLNAITMAEIDEATDRVLMGPAKVSHKITPKEKELIALHESGHAVIGMKVPDAEVVHKITIIPRGVAGGYTMMLPKEEKIAIMTKSELLSTITGLLGGRVSEELFFGEITRGASDDFSKATKIARSMVTEYGMSDLGPVQLEHKSEGVFLGRDYNKSQNLSDAIAEEIDKEVRKIMDECYKHATKILKENADLVKLLSDTLIERETITKEEIEELVATGHISDESKEEDLKMKARELGIKGYTKMTDEVLKEAIKTEENKIKDSNNH